MIAFCNSELMTVKLGTFDISKVCLGSIEIWPNSEVETHSISIEGPTDIIGETGNLSVLYDTVTPVTTGIGWTIFSGNEYATIDATGLITINSIADDNEIVIRASYGDLSASKTVRVTYQVGSTTETEVETVTDEDGNTTTTVISVVTNEDGSSEQNSTSTTYDFSGNVTGTSENTTINNADGSSSSSTINYDSNGDPTTGENVITDTVGNVDTQEIEYNEDGDPVVTGYTIDTSASQGEGKQVTNGVNTEYYAFDVTRGFILDFDFTINFADQPAGQDENHHNILTMKRANPSPWYGFQLRQSSTNKYIILGTQFATGSNTNTELRPATLVNNTAEYNLRIKYDPTADTNKFICWNMDTGAVIFSSNNTFPDIEALRYLRVTIGYAMDPNGDPYRYSNINVKNFSIEKLSAPVAVPVITCSNNLVTITCSMTEASIYYRLNQTGSFILYSTPIQIYADTIVEAYAEFEGRTSETVTENCVYDSGIENPVIECNGEEVTITCETLGVNLYYRINQTGNFLLYEYAIPILEDTFVEAYAELNGDVSHTVSKTCIYDGGVRKPVISCDGDYVTLTCESIGASIYYRIDQIGEFELYESPIQLTETVVVEAYSKLDEKISPIVAETCIFNPINYYKREYLTIKVLTDGTIGWNSIGTGAAKTIQYSKNDGQWTSLIASSTTTISVVTGDVIRIKGTNTRYCEENKANYSSFGSTEAGVGGGTALFEVEGNVMSLIYGDNFLGQTTLTSTYNFCQLFKCSHCVSAENLVLPTMVLTQYCYRAMFSRCTDLIKAPALPATTLAKGCYWYMFDKSTLLTDAPELPAQILVAECYGHMFEDCSNINYIKCLSTDGFTATDCKTSWTKNVAASGTFIKDNSVSESIWTIGINGIPKNWVVLNDGDIILEDPSIICDGEEVTIICETPGAEIYYNINQNRSYTLYTEPIAITEDVTVSAYSIKGSIQSSVISESCVYSPETPLQASNKDITSWRYNGLTVTTPYSVNAIDGHSSSYSKGTFNFETDIKFKKVQPAYLWFQHADQSATIYVDNTLVEKHWGGYNAFFIDLGSNIQKGMHTIRVALKNNEGNYLAPCSGDFNFNATLGNVKLFTSPVLPAMKYGYDGFHVTSTVTTASATIVVRTNIPLGASVVCTIDDGTYHYSDTANSTGEEMSFTTTIQNPHLWNGLSDPHLYTITLEIYYNGELYHRYQRPYGLRFYRYAINDTTILPNNEPYTGFVLNGVPYQLRGVCMHDDIDNKANALTDADYDQTFSIIRELGCNFIRLAHYPHPKEVYDRCDQMGIVVQTEGPCVNKMQSTMPTDYYDHLNTQYDDMVNQHYNHPCIIFWGLSNETTTDDKVFANTKINGYIARIRALDSERMIGYVMAQGASDPSAYYNDPNADWFGCNIYEGWYSNKNSNNPTSAINTRVKNLITNKNKAIAYSEYGCGGTQHCHSDDPLTTTTRGNYERHDIEYMMWLHEGHIAAIKQHPELLFTAQWQLFDIAVTSRNEGYTVCLDGVNTSTDDNLRRLNDKGLVERDHITKKDPFYLYKAWWNPTPFVHICGKDYQKLVDRVIKCYSNDGTSLSLYVNDVFIETVTITDNIALFTSRTFSSGDVIRVQGSDSSDTFTI